MVEWPDGSQVALTEDWLVFAKRPLKTSYPMRNKTLWSEEMKIELFGGANAWCHFWLPNSEALWWQHQLLELGDE